MSCFLCLEHLCLLACPPDVAMPGQLRSMERLRSWRTTGESKVKTQIIRGNKSHDGKEENMLENVMQKLD